MVKKFSLDGEAQCGKCVYYEELRSADDGEFTIGNCHRFPPSVKPKDRELTDDPVSLTWSHPVVLSCNACGEFITAD
jgi:hypothetical protein